MTQNNPTFPIILLVILFGYYIKTKSARYLDKYDDIQIQSYQNLGESPQKETNPYSSNRINEVNAEMLDKSFTMYDKAMNPQETGVLAPLFNSYPDLLNINSIGNPNVSNFLNSPSSEQLAQISDLNRLGNYRDSSLENLENMPMFNSGSYSENLIHSPTTEFFENIPLNNINPLTDLPYETSHNNMTPFFGSHVKQKLDFKSNKSLLDLYTGNTDTYIHKKETKPFFEQQTQNIHSVLTTDYIALDRFIPSRFRQSEKPFEPLKVRADSQGLIDTERASYKTIDELRRKDNQQISYAGRTVNGQKGELFSGKNSLGIVQKNTVERTFSNPVLGTFSQNTNVTYTSPEIILRNTNNFDTELNLGPVNNPNIGIRQYITPQ